MRAKPRLVEHTPHHAAAPYAIFVASPDVLAAWSARAQRAGDVQGFTDSDSHGALEAISRHHPEVVVLEQLFAASPRGVAFVNRLRTDPMLAAIEVRLLSAERAAALASGSSKTAAGVVALASPISQQPIRRAMRIRMPEGIAATVDGSQTLLVDLSVCGAQVVSPAVLKPRQRVRMVLDSEEAAIRVIAGIAWASFEMPRGISPQYRAGLEFSEADPRAVEAFYTQLKLHQG
ncbi:MAG: PilZ domain-containing protein [Acidobacteria bacterium]|nr:PilZ domain-containing protein [Acidobacteriota bacterium]